MTAKVQPLIVLAGETASGKSAAGMEVARRFDGEIIASDSRTVYKYMDIGTAKPDADDQAEIPHHLLDVVEPGEKYSAAQFKDAANAAIADIHERGKLPIMIGGTGLYIDSVIFDYNFNDRGDENERAELEKLDDNGLLERAKELGVELDHEDLKNRRYAIRTIQTRGKKNNDRAQMRENTLVLAISWPRNALRKRIEDRVEIQFRQGLRQEVDELQKKYGWDNESMSGIGYQEFEPFYTGKISMSQVKRDIVKNTVQYAKRQRTWFKRNPNIVTVELAEQAVQEAADFLANNG